VIYARGLEEPAAIRALRLRPSVPQRHWIPSSAMAKVTAKKLATLTRR
jgi:hypothetical protein